MYFLDAIRIFSHVTIICGRLSRFRINTNRRERRKKREMCVLPPVCTVSFRSARLSRWTWIDFYTQLRATDWNRVTFYIYPHFPLTIGLPEMVASIRELLPTDDYGALRSLCSRFEKRAESIHNANFRFWSLFIFCYAFVISLRKYRTNFPSSFRVLTFKRSNLFASVI